jgi:hypothetical protein
MYNECDLVPNVLKIYEGVYEKVTTLLSLSSYKALYNRFDKYPVFPTSKFKEFENSPRRFVPWVQTAEKNLYQGEVDDKGNLDGRGIYISPGSSV